MAEQITIETPYGPTSAQHWYLSDEEQMWQALKELITRGHRGVVMEWPDGDGNPVWQLELNDYAGHAVTAVLGQHLVLAEQLWAYDGSYYESIKR
jgi:hypothetical protein